MGLRYWHKSENRFFDLFKFKSVDIVPNLLIIGAQKSGTTSLHNYLDQHPKIHMSKPIKEPGYFLPFNSIADYFKKKGLNFKDKYELLDKQMLHGYKGQPFCGESSTFYTTLSQNGNNDLAKRIKTQSPNVKLIYIIRHPLERIISHYIHENSRLRFLGNVTQFCKQNPEALGITNYYNQLQPYVKEFGKENILLLKFDDLKNNGLQLMKQIEQFVGVEEFDSYKFDKFNTSDNKDVDPVQTKFNPNYLKNIIDGLKEQVSLIEKDFNIDLSHWTYKNDDWCFKLKPKKKEGPNLKNKKPSKKAK